MPVASASGSSGTFALFRSSSRALPSNTKEKAATAAKRRIGSRPKGPPIRQFPPATWPPPDGRDGNGNGNGHNEPSVFVAHDIVDNDNGSPSASGDVGALSWQMVDPTLLPNFLSDESDGDSEGEAEGTGGTALGGQFDLTSWFRPSEWFDSTLRSASFGLCGPRAHNGVPAPSPRLAVSADQHVPPAGGDGCDPPPADTAASPLGPPDLILPADPASGSARGKPANRGTAPDSESGGGRQAGTIFVM